MIIQDLYTHNFGIIIPKKNGIKWKQQTNGVCCNHIQIEGIFIPLHRPKKYVEGKDFKVIDLLNKLEEANYDYNYKKVKSIWNEIKKDLFFEYEEIENPKRKPKNQEGLQWIRIIKIKKTIMDWNNWDDLIGKEVVLIYPNCD